MKQYANMGEVFEALFDAEEKLERVAQVQKRAEERFGTCYVGHASIHRSYADELAEALADGGESL